MSQINPSPGVDLPWSHVEYFVKLQAQVRDQWNSVSGMSPVCSCPHRSPWPPKPSTPHHPSPTQWPQHANCIHLEATPINSTSTGYRPHKASYGTSSPSHFSTLCTESLQLRALLLLSPPQIPASFLSVAHSKLQDLKAVAHDRQVLFDSQQFSGWGQGAMGIEGVGPLVTLHPLRFFTSLMHFPSATRAPPRTRALIQPCSD